jgi:pimeloyl-ACP methyl ester carboxylesterase
MSSDYDPRISIEGDGTPLVLVPGLNGTGELFYRQISSLRRRYRVATYTLRDDAPTLKVLVDDMAHVIDQVAPIERRAIVVGESFGGAVALTFALTYPERVSSLVIVNSFARLHAQLRLRLAIAGLTLVPWRAIGPLRRLAAFRLHSRQTSRAEVNRFIALTTRATRRGYVGRLKLLREYDVRHRLHEVRHPTLFLAADGDHLVPALMQAQYMTDRVAASRMRVLNGHGHICLIAPDVDLGTILDEWRGDVASSAEMSPAS